MKICYLSASRGIFRGNIAGSVHVRSIIAALRNLGHHVYLIYVGLKRAEGFEGATDVLEIGDIMGFRLIYRLIDVIWYKVVRYVLSFDIWQAKFDRWLACPPIILALMNEVMQIAINYKVYTKARRFFVNHEIDAIYERSCGYNRSGAWLAQRFGIPLILEVNALVSYEQIMYRQAYFPNLLKQLERKTLKRADAIVAISNVVKQQLVTFGIQRSKIYVLSNGVNVHLFHPKISGNGVREQYNLSRKVVVGFVGEFRSWHGLHRLLEAAKVLAVTCPDVHFLIVGDGPERPLLEKNMKRWNLENHVTFTGLIPHHHIFKFLAAIDIGVMPNSSFYMCPIKILEYMAMGKPTVAPRYEPIRELIIHGKEGLLFEPDSKAQFVESLALLINNEELRKRLGWAAREKVVKKHTWESCAHTIVDIIHNERKNQQ